jgi:hypothetical protein
MIIRINAYQFINQQNRPSGLHLWFLFGFSAGQYKRTPLDFSAGVLLA